MTLPPAVRAAAEYLAEVLDVSPDAAHPLEDYRASVEAEWLRIKAAAAEDPERARAEIEQCRRVLAHGDREVWARYTLLRLAMWRAATTEEY